MLAADSPTPGFQLFGLVHAAVVGAFVLIVSALVLLRRRARGTDAEKMDMALAVFALMAAVITNGAWLLPANFSLAKSLPLHVCDLATFVAPLALIGRWRGWRGLLYFYGLGLSIWGFITPDLGSGPNETGFWLFWLTHFSVVGISIYDLLARHYRPTRHDLRIALLCAVGYALTVIPIDMIFNVNYGYFGSSDAQPPVILMLGDWPWRVPVLIAVGMLLFVAMTLPLGQRHRRSDEEIYGTS